jgi:glycosyltransferase involved in cell wall biosynthesis
LKRASKITRLWEALSVVPASAAQLGRARLGIANRPGLYYVAPDHEWVTYWVGYYITRLIRQQFNWPARLISTPQFLTGQILHYGELGTFLHSLGTARNNRNILLMTLFHGDLNPGFPELRDSVQRCLDNLDKLACLHTASRIMYNRLLDWGAPEEKVVRIPLGVDLKLFAPPTAEQKKRLRQQLGIPQGAICIGSFQKDGVGWGAGLAPKLVKGPDIFLKVIERLKREFKLFVLLTGPARGFVKRGLEALGVVYRHDILQDFTAIPDYYRALDLYLVTSREEGGPKAVLEALASGTPLVSTRVGLAPDIIQHAKNGLLADIEDVETLAKQAARIIEDNDLRQRLIAQGLADIVQYNWDNIAASYYYQLYQPLLDKSAH